MRRINLEDYIIHGKVVNPNPEKDGQMLIDTQILYPVKDTIIALLFAPKMGLNGIELVRQKRLVDKIEACQNGSIVLETEGWDRLVAAVNKAVGFSKNDVELVERILDAPEVDVT